MATKRTSNFDKLMRTLEGLKAVSAAIARRGGIMPLGEAIRRSEERLPGVDPKSAIRALGLEHAIIPGEGFVGGAAYPDEIDAARARSEAAQNGGGIEEQVTVIRGERRRF